MNKLDGVLLAPALPFEVGEEGGGGEPRGQGARGGKEETVNE